MNDVSKAQQNANYSCQRLDIRRCENDGTGIKRDLIMKYYREINSEISAIIPGRRLNAQNAYKFVKVKHTSKRRKQKPKFIDSLAEFVLRLLF